MLLGLEEVSELLLFPVNGHLTRLDVVGQSFLQRLADHRQLVTLVRGLRETSGAKD